MAEAQNAGRLEVDVIANLKRFARDLREKVEAEVGDLEVKIETKIDEVVLRAQLVTAVKFAQKGVVAEVEVKFNREKIKKALQEAISGPGGQGDFGIGSAMERAIAASAMGLDISTNVESINAELLARIKEAEALAKANPIDIPTRAGAVGGAGKSGGAFDGRGGGGLLPRRGMLRRAAPLLIATFIEPLVSALGALGGGLVAMTGAAAPALKTLGLLPGAISAVAVAAGAGVIAFQGFGTAMKSANEIAGKIERGEPITEEEYDALVKAMDKLTPSAQEAVTQLIGLRGEWKKLKETTQEALFKPFADDIERVGEKVLPLLERAFAGAGTAIGESIGKFGEWFESDEFAEKFDRITLANNTFLTSMGSATLNLSKALQEVMDAAAPVMVRAGEAFDRWSAAFAERTAEKNTSRPLTPQEEGQKRLAEASGMKWEDPRAGEPTQLTKSFDEALDTLLAIMQGVSDLWGGIKGIFSAGEDVGKSLGASLGTALADWNTWVNSPEGQEKIKKWFEDIEPAFREIVGLGGDLVEIFLAWAADPNTKDFIVKIRELVGELAELFKTLGANVAGSITAVFTAFVKVVNSVAPEAIWVLSKAIEALAIALTVLAVAFDGIPLLGPIIGTLIGFFLAWKLLTKLTRGLGRLGRALRDKGKNLARMAKEFKNADNKAERFKKAIFGTKKALDDEIKSDKKKGKALDDLAKDFDDATKSARKFTDAIEQSDQELADGINFNQSQKPPGAPTRPGPGSIGMPQDSTVADSFAASRAVEAARKQADEIEAIVRAHAKRMLEIAKTAQASTERAANDHADRMERAARAQAELMQRIAEVGAQRASASPFGRTVVAGVSRTIEETERLAREAAGRAATAAETACRLATAKAAECALEKFNAGEKAIETARKNAPNMPGGACNVPGGNGGVGVDVAIPLPTPKKGFLRGAGSKIGQAGKFLGSKAKYAKGAGPVGAAITVASLAANKNVQNVLAMPGKWVTDAVVGAKNAVVKHVPGIVGKVGDGLSKVPGVFKSIFNKGKNVSSEILGATASAAGPLGAKVSSSVSSGINSGKGAVANASKSVASGIKPPIEAVDLNASGGSLMSSLTAGISNAAGSVWGAAKSVATGIRNLFPFSPAKEGPLRDYPLDYAGSVLMRDLAKGIKKGSTKVFDNVAEVAQGLIDALTPTMDDTKIAAAFEKMSEKKATKLRKALEKQNKKFEKLAIKREEIQGRLDGAKSELDGLKQDKKLRTFQKGMGDQFASYGDVASAYKEDFDVDATGMIERLQRRVEATKKYGANLAKLAKTKLNADALRQVSEAGAQDGGKLAETLANATPAQIDAINKAQSELRAAGEKAGDALVPKLVDPAIAKAKALFDKITAEMKVNTAAMVIEANKMGDIIGKALGDGLIKGILSKSGELQKTMKKVAEKDMTEPAKKKLKLKSPSRVFWDIGRNTMKGLMMGITGEHGNVSKTIAGVANTLAGMPVPDLSMTGMEAFSSALSNSRSMKGLMPAQSTGPQPLIGGDLTMPITAASPKAAMQDLEHELRRLRLGGVHVRR